MKTTKLICGSALVLVLMSLTILLDGCSAKKNAWGDPSTGLILEYRMPETENLQYDLTSEFVMGMEVMGQKIDIKSNSQNVFTMDLVAVENGNHKLNVSIDTVYMHVVSPKGEIDPDMSSVIGQQFDLVVSPKGKEIDYSGAEALKYNLGGVEELNLSGDFQTVFPNLPDNAIKVGESWNTIDTIIEKSSGGYLMIIANLVNTIEALETYKGYECVKVNSTYKGVLEGESETQGVEMKTTGTIEGKDTWYFAYKEGIFIKNASEGKAISRTETTSDQKMVIPGTRDFAFAIELIGK